MTLSSVPGVFSKTPRWPFGTGSDILASLLSPCPRVLVSLCPGVLIPLVPVSPALPPHLHDFPTCDKGDKPPVWPNPQRPPRVWGAPGDGGVHSSGCCPPSPAPAPRCPPRAGATMGPPGRVPLVLLLLLVAERTARGTFPEEPGPIAVAPPDCE